MSSRIIGCYFNICVAPQLRVQELNKELQSAKESSKAARGREEALKEQMEEVSGDLHRSQRTQSRLQGEKDQRDQEVQELRQRIKRLSSGLQVHITTTKDSR